MMAPLELAVFSRRRRGDVDVDGHHYCDVNGRGDGSVTDDGDDRGADGDGDHGEDCTAMTAISLNAHVLASLCRRWTIWPS